MVRHKLRSSQSNRRLLRNAGARVKSRGAVICKCLRLTIPRPGHFHQPSSTQPRMILAPFYFSPRFASSLGHSAAHPPARAPRLSDQKGSTRRAGPPPAGLLVLRARSFQQFSRAFEVPFSRAPCLSLAPPFVIAPGFFPSLSCGPPPARRFRPLMEKQTSPTR